jgi:hypothetical protein
VGDGIAEQTEPPQDEIIADQSARKACQDGGEDGGQVDLEKGLQVGHGPIRHDDCRSQWHGGVS